MSEQWYLTPHKDAAAQGIYSTRPGPVISGQDVTGDHVGYVYRREDGERIVAAVNNHDDLLALLIELTDIEGPQPGHVGWYRKVQAAIAKTTAPEPATDTEGE